MRISSPLNWVYPTHNLKEPVSDQPDRLFLVAPLFLFQTFHHAHIGRANDFVCADKFFHTVSTPPNNTGHSEQRYGLKSAVAKLATYLKTLQIKQLELLNEKQAENLFCFLLEGICSMIYP